MALFLNAGIKGVYHHAQPTTSSLESSSPAYSQSGKIRVYLWNVSSWLRTPFKLFKPQLHFLCQSSLGLIQILVESMCHSHGERESFKSRYIGYMQSSLLMATVGLRMVVISFFVPDSMAQDTLLGNLLKNQLKSFISA